MSLKMFVNNPDLWKAFLEEVDEELAKVHRRMEQEPKVETLYQLQGTAQAYHHLKRLRDRVNAR